MATELLARKKPFKRKTQTCTAQHAISAVEVYRQLRTTRAADWIEGWGADVIYTESGCSEPDCVLSTPPQSILGSGLWIITQTHPSSHHELVHLRDDGVAGHYTIRLDDKRDVTCDNVWTLVFTAVSEAGKAVIEAMPKMDAGF